MAPKNPNETVPIDSVRRETRADISGELPKPTSWRAACQLLVISEGAHGRGDGRGESEGNIGPMERRAACIRERGPTGRAAWPGVDGSAEAKSARAGCVPGEWDHRI